MLPLTTTITYAAVITAAATGCATTTTTAITSTAKSYCPSNYHTIYIILTLSKRSIS